MSSGTHGAAARPLGFDVLRIVAASMVVVSHVFLLRGDAEPIVLSTQVFDYNLGRLGVIVFFVVSGYLICGSWLSDPRPAAFAERRARRLMPGLAVMLLLVVFVVGPLVTTDDGYFSRSQTYEFLLRNLLVFPYAYELPGVFESNAEPIVNGVLWTLGVEVLAYTLLAVAGWFGLLRRPLVLAGVAAALALAGWRLPHEVIADGALVPVALRVELVAYFFAAAAVKAYGWRPGVRAALVSLLVVGLIGLTQAPLTILLVPALTVVVLYVGTRSWPAAHAVTRFGDPSYGTYIYGYVIQQLLVGPAGLDAAPVWTLMTASLVLCLGAGYASWHLVEKRLLRRGRPAAPAVPADAGPGRALGRAPGSSPRPSAEDSGARRSG